MVIAAVTFMVGVIMIDAMSETQETIMLSSVKDRVNYEAAMMTLEEGACAGTRLSHLTLEEGNRIVIGLSGPCAPEEENEQKSFLARVETGVETLVCGAPADGYEPDGVISCGGRDYPLEYYKGESA